MAVVRIASRYAKPLLDLARERGVSDQVKEDMEDFLNLCQQNRHFVVMLKSPILPHLRKNQILKHIFEGKVNDLTFQAFDLIIRKSRENLLTDIAEEFLNQYYLSKGLEKTDITTSIPLNTDQKNMFEKITSRITGKKNLLNEHVDADIIGGCIIKTGDRQIDLSVSGQLKNIKLKLLKSST